MLFNILVTFFLTPSTLMVIRSDLCLLTPSSLIGQISYNYLMLLVTYLHTPPSSIGQLTHNYLMLLELKTLFWLLDYSSTLDTE